MATETQATTVRLPVVRYEQLRRLAFDRHESINSVVDLAVSLLTDDTGLRRYPLDMMAAIRCPDDCGAEYYPDSLGEAIDWAAGHRCEKGS